MRVPFFPPCCRAVRLIPLLLLAASLTAATAASAVATSRQSAEQEVIDTVQALFDAMASRDAGVLGTLLVPEGRVIAMRGDQTAGTPGSTSQADFVTSIANSRGDLLERMWEPEVRIDGSIAFLRAPYDFYRDGVFSHCGVDHFSLVRTDEGWKIAGIVYTVQREGCEPSPLGEPR